LDVAQATENTNVSTSQAVNEYVKLARNANEKNQLLSYELLENTLKEKDPEELKKLVNNQFLMAYQFGFMKKKAPIGWDERFFVLTNSGMVYFRKQNVQFKCLDDYRDNDFKPLTFFVVRIPENEKGVKFPLRVDFLMNDNGGDSKVAKEWLLDCPNEQEQMAWLVALKRYQL